MNYKRQFKLVYDTIRKHPGFKYELIALKKVWTHSAFRNYQLVIHGQPIADYVVRNLEVFDFIKEIFTPAANVVDELHFSGEEAGKIKNELAQIEAKVAIKLMDLQMQVVKANGELAKAEQEHGNWLSKSWRPACSLTCMGLLVAMGLQFIPRDELLMQICGGFLGLFMPLRSWEKKK
jgi:hypothetical protein